jgi:hypothetical protein
VSSGSFVDRAAPDGGDGVAQLDDDGRFPLADAGEVPPGAAARDRINHSEVMTMRTLPRLVLAGVLATLMAACGGSTASAPPGTGGPPTSTPASLSNAPAPSAEPGGAASPTPAPTTGGGGTDDVCALVSADELAGIFGVPSVTTAVLAGPPDTCDIQADGAPLAAMVYMPSNGAVVFSAWAADPTAVDMPGIGDRAAYLPGQLLFIVLRGDATLSLAVLDESRSEDARLELMKEIAAIAAGRM